MLCRFDNHKLMIMLQDFEINGSREFLSIFWNSKNMFRLSPQMVDKLSKSEDPYGKYGYGQWLYRTQYDEESWKLAWDCFKFASDNGVADATYLISPTKEWVKTTIRLHNNLRYNGQFGRLDGERTTLLRIEQILGYIVSLVHLTIERFTERTLLNIHLLTPKAVECRHL